MMDENALKQFMKKAAKAYEKDKKVEEKVADAHVKKTPASKAKTPSSSMKRIQRAGKTVQTKRKHTEEMARLGKMLEEHGVPKKLSKRMHEIVKKPEEPEKNEEIKGAIKEAIEHKKNGKIGEESLTKIVQEAIREHEKGVSKEEIRDIIKEVLRSELQKGALMGAYYPPRPKEVVEEEIGDKKAPKKELDMPLPSKGDGERFKRKRTSKTTDWDGIEMDTVNITYPLIFRGGKVHVYANIRYDPTMQGLIYRVIEPQLTKEEETMLNKVETTLVEELEVDFSALKKQTAEKYLMKKIDGIIDYYKLKLTERARDLMVYYIYRDFIGLSRVEPMMQDPNIEDISCDGINVPIYIYHRDPRFGSIRTNIKFEDKEKLNSFVMKLAQRCNRSISVADPLLDGALPDGSRVQATFGSGIAMKGSNFTIRKFTVDPLTCVDLMNYGTIDAEMLAYLWMAIEHGKSVLIAGPTASGKTTMLNTLSLFIRPELKIISIEDTPELRLPHENWIAQVARIGFGPEMESGKKMGEVSLFDLLKASLRQRPDTIIVGEVRGQEAYVLFQQMATGHPGISTIHAESMTGVINRLRTPPISLPPSLVQHLDILIVLARQRIKGRYMRRTKEITEIVGYDIEKDTPLMNVAYDWVSATDEFKYSGKSAMLKDVMETTGADVNGIFAEVERRMKVLEWMQDNGVRDYKNVGRVVREYYQNPTDLMEKISEV